MKLKQFLELAEHDKETLDLMYSEEMDEIDKLLGLTEVTVITEKAIELTPQVWGDIAPGKTEQDRQKEAKRIYQMALDMAKKVKRKFIAWLRKVSQKIRNVKILVDIKTIESFLDKTIARGRPASDVTDVLRSAILAETNDDVEDIANNIQRRMKVAKYKKKESGSDPKYGYFGSHHFLVRVDQIIAEIQVMTRKLWSYKEEAHQIYSKYRSAKDVDKRIEQADTELSKLIFQKANVDNPYLKQRAKGKGKGKRARLGKGKKARQKKWKWQPQKYEPY